MSLSLDEAVSALNSFYVSHVDDGYNNRYSQISGADVLRGKLLQSIWDRLQNDKTTRPDDVIQAGTNVSNDTVKVYFTVINTADQTGALHFSSTGVTERVLGFNAVVNWQISNENFAQDAHALLQQDQEENPHWPGYEDEWSDGDGGW
jgi:hypothetical protein